MSKNNLAKHAVIVPSEQDAAFARMALASAGDTNIEETEHCQIPIQLITFLREILIRFAEGHAVALVPCHQEMTTQAAADLLNVSRPHLVKLLETGVIPFHKVGTHRRIRLEDVLTYKEKLTKDRLNVLDELTSQAQELNLGY